MSADPMEPARASAGRGRSARPVAEVRADILQAAFELFRQRGYERVTLTEIGAIVGLTRGAVLYHYASKAEVLIALVSPYIQRIDELVERWESADPAPPPVEVLTGVFDAMLEVRPAGILLTRDLSAADAVELGSWSAGQSARIMALLAQGSADADAQFLRGAAALGAIGRPLPLLPETVTPYQRETILRAAVNALYPGDAFAAAGESPVPLPAGESAATGEAVGHDTVGGQDPAVAVAGDEQGSAAAPAEEAAPTAVGSYGRLTSVGGDSTPSGLRGG